MEKTRYGIIGLGNAGQVHEKVLRRFEDTELVSICDTDPLKKSSLATYVNFYEDYFNMLQKENIDAVSICTPHNLHAEMTISALERGIHVLCEKPLALELADADRMIQSAEANGRYLATISQQRFEPINQKIKKEIDSGKLGEIISTSLSVKWRKSEDYYRNSWHGRKKEAGGGVLINQAIHYIDLACWFNGGISSVYAMAKTSRNYIDVEDNAVAMVRYRNGAFGVYDCSTSTNPFIGTGLDIVGSKNSIKMFEGRVIEWGGKNPEEIEKINDEITELDKETWGKKYFGYGHIFQIRNFIDSVRNNVPVYIDGREGKRTLEVVMALMRSADIGNEVKL